MAKDWVGNGKSIYSTLGASSHTDHEREKNDYYATPFEATKKLLEVETFSPHIYECCCGEGHISKVLEEAGYEVKSTDLIDRGYGQGHIDFLTITKEDMSNDVHRDIITNPPYKIASECVEHALDISEEGTKVAMFLKIQFLESKKRAALFKKYPPKYVYVFTERVKCGMNGDFSGGSSAVCFSWFLWEKGFKGEPVVRWL